MKQSLTTNHIQKLQKDFGNLGTLNRAFAVKQDEMHLVKYVRSAQSVLHTNVFDRCLCFIKQKKKAAVNLQNYTKEYIPYNS
jgi:cell fate (sporulation/competence/biofilm development) regulator YmcA (YheA/YmcA/DUF963 family)